jgi:predicted nucleic acid-binding protein
MIVLDANILIRAVLGRRVRQLLEHYAHYGVRFYAPGVAYSDAQRHLPELLKKFGKHDGDVPAELQYLQSLVEPVESESYVAFEDEARTRLRARDEENWPVLAAALALACAIWTEDMDFFGTGVPIWTTK